MNEVDDFLQHHGVLGMKWGVRKAELPGVSRGTNKEAKKDAQEFARAKMFYGDGAGNRRKLIKATVEAKSQKDPAYKEAFDYHLNNQDMSTHAAKARSERKRKDVVQGTAKTARGIKNTIFGNPAYASTLAVTLVAAGTAAHRAGLDKLAVKHSKTAYSLIKREALTLKIMRDFKKGGLF